MPLEPEARQLHAIGDRGAVILARVAGAAVTAGGAGRDGIQPK
jgi:hypothetical protein